MDRSLGSTAATTFVGSRQVSAILATSTSTAVEDVRSEIPIESVTSPSHGDEFVTARHADSYWQASLETTGGDLNRDVVLAFKTERARTGLDLVASRESGEDGFFQLTFTQLL